MRTRQRVWVASMLAYTLTVFEKGTLLAVESVTLNGAPAVMKAIPELLAKHPGCEIIRVHAGPTYLFSVDCKGDTINE